MTCTVCALGKWRKKCCCKTDLQLFFYKACEHHEKPWIIKSHKKSALTCMFLLTDRIILLIISLNKITLPSQTPLHNLNV